MRVIFNVTSALLVSVAVGILMVNVSSLSWMREPPSPQPALGGSLSKYDHGVDKVDSAKARIVVERRTRLTRYVLPSELVGAADEERLDASGQGFGDSIRHKVCHSTAAYPATRDVDMLVPESNIQLGSVEAPVCRIYGCVA